MYVSGMTLFLIFAVILIVADNNKKAKAAEAPCRDDNEYNINDDDYRLREYDEED